MCLFQAGSVCPAPLVAVAGRCEAPDTRVLVPETVFELNSADWEAEGRVASRRIHTRAFRVDAFEVTVGRLCVDWGHVDDLPVSPVAQACSRFPRELAAGDLARAAAGLTRDEAAAFCASQGGRLPTEDEWIVAVAAAKPVRYPWGDTGAVCRRAAWGLRGGPCAKGGAGPDTVGTHPAGDNALGLHDAAGNVAEWTAPGADGVGFARGGSWTSELATELRVWSRLELPATRADERVGVRCAYDESTPSN